MYYESNHVVLRRVNDEKCVIVQPNAISLYTLEKDDLDKAISEMDKSTKGKFISASKEVLKLIKSQIK